MAKKRKNEKNPWEKIDREVVTALTNEFKAIHTIYTSQDVDPLAIASAYWQQDSGRCTNCVNSFKFISQSSNY